MKMNVVFILDNSGSVEAEYSQSVAFARLVVSGLDVTNDNARVGAITFSDEVVGQFYMKDYIGQAVALYNAFDFYDVFGTTNTPAALTDAQTQQFTMANGDRDGIPNYIVIVSDGYSDVNQQNTIPDAMALKNQGVTIYSIAVGPDPQYSELNGMASTPSSQYVIPLPMMGNITSTANTLLQRLCTPIACLGPNGQC